MKNIHIIELGGTISAQGKNRLDFKDYQSGVFQGEDFLNVIPEIHSIANVTFETFLRVTSTAITSDHWIQLREKVIHTLAKDNVDGMVITHGTNTLEETAYFLHLTVATNKPIILTGAQKPFTALSSDAHNNLIQSIRTAASDEAWAKGVLVILNEEINGARDVTKTNTYRHEAFQSGQLGHLGYVDADGKITFYRYPAKKHTTSSVFSNLTFTFLPNVAILYSYAGSTGDLIEYITKSGDYAGIIIAGTGAGLASPSELTALQEATKQGITVARSSRVGNGRVIPIEPYDTYSFISADNLSPQKARILLMLALLHTNKNETIQQFFHEY